MLRIENNFLALFSNYQKANELWVRRVLPQTTFETSQSPISILFRLKIDTAKVAEPICNPMGEKTCSYLHNKNKTKTFHRESFNSLRYHLAARNVVGNIKNKLIYCVVQPCFCCRFELFIAKVQYFTACGLRCNFKHVYVDIALCYWTIW